MNSITRKSLLALAAALHTFTGGDDDLNGGVTRRCGRGSEYSDDDIIENIYYAPIRVVK